MPTLFSSAEIGQQIEDSLKEIDTINEFAKTKDRELTDEESKKQSDLLARVKQLQPRLADSKEFESFKEKADASHPVKAVQPLTSSGRPAKPFNEPQWEVPYAIRGRQFPFKAFRGQFATENAYAAGMQLMAMVGYDQGRKFCDEHSIRYSVGKEVFNAQTEGTGSEGGYTVPDPLSSTIIEVRERIGITRRVADVVPMTSDTLNVPKISSGQTVYYPGEATAITASDLVWASVALSVVKRATLTKISRELQADSVVRVADRVANRAAYQLALQEDNELINGDGTSTYGSETGLVSAIAAGETKTQGTGTTWGAIVIADFDAQVGLLGDEYHEGAQWICSRAFFSTVIEPLVLAQGGSTGAEMSAGAARTFKGYPISFTSKMPTATAVTTVSCLFGNFMEAVMVGDREGVEVASSEDYAFDEDVTTQRLTTRYDINVHNTAAYTGLKTGT